MTTDTAEYLGQQDQTEAAPATNGKTKDTTLAIFQTRKNALEDSGLSHGAAKLFVYLLDLACNPWTRYKRQGATLISVDELCGRLKCCEKSIYEWTKQLVELRYIWLSQKARPNTDPMNVYHITALQPQTEQGPDLPGDGMWGNGRRRSARLTGLGARGQCKKRSYLFDQFGHQIFLQAVENQAGNGNSYASRERNLRQTVAENGSGERQNLRQTVEETTVAHSKKVYPRAVESSTPPQQKHTALRESIDVSRRPLESFNNVQRPNARKRGSENDYLQRVLETLSLWKPSWAQKEMVNSGAWWRLGYRANPDKAERVLAEIGRMIKEGESFTLNPGAAAVDLWDRFASR